MRGPFDAVPTIAPCLALPRESRGLSQKRPPEDPELAEAQQNLRVARLADHIKRCVDQAPALTAEQRNQLAELLRPVRGA